MDNLQYLIVTLLNQQIQLRFKPYYKWITFNTVLEFNVPFRRNHSFKPYYKWITLNTISNHFVASDVSMF